MKKVLLLSVNDIISGSVIEDNVDVRLLSKTIGIAQETGLKPILGTELFESLIDAVYNYSVSGTPLTTAYSSLIEVAKPYLLAKTVADFMVINNYKITNKGVMKLNDNSATSLSDSDLESVKNYYDNLISTYKSELVKFLKDTNLIDYKNDIQISSESTGWFLGNPISIVRPTNESAAEIASYVAPSNSEYNYQQIEALRNVLLISSFDIISNSVIEDNVDVKLLSRTIQTVQEVNLKPILSESVYWDTVNAVYLNKVSGTTISSFYTDLISLVKPYMVNKVVAEFIIPNNYKFTAKGLLKLNDNSATSLSDSDLENVKNHYDNLSTSYKLDIINFLKKYNLVDCNTDADITSDATGWFLSSKISRPTTTSIIPSSNSAMELTGAYLPLSGGTLTGALGMNMLNPTISLKQDTTNQEFKIRVGLNTGIANSNWNLFDATANKVRLLLRGANFGVGNVTTVPAESLIYGFGGINGANLDMRPDPANGYDEANIECENSDYQTSGHPYQGYGIAMQHSGSGTSSTYLGYSSKLLSQLRFTANNNLIRVINNAPLRFSTSEVERMVIGADGKIGIGLTAATHPFHVSAATNPVRFEGLQSASDTSILTVDASGVVHTILASTLSGSSGSYLPLSGGTLTGNVGIGTAPFTGATTPIASLELGNFNGTNANGNLIVRGYSALGGVSKSGYGAVGSNYYLSSANVLLRKNTDSVSLIEFSNGGFIFKNAGSGAANSSISLATYLSVSSVGNIVGTSTVTSAAGTGIGNSFTTNHTVNTSASYIGTNFISEVSSSSSNSSAIVAQAATINQNSSTNLPSSLIGYQINVNHKGTGTIQELTAVSVGGYIANSGRATTTFGVKNQGWFTPSTGTIGIQYGYYYDQTYITPTTGYAFYSVVNPNGGTLASATDVSIMPASTKGVGIGINVPTNKLHVSAATNPVRFVGLQSSNDTTLLTVDANGVLHTKSASETTYTTDSSDDVTYISDAGIHIILGDGSQGVQFDDPSSHIGESVTVIINGYGDGGVIHVLGSYIPINALLTATFDDLVSGYCYVFKAVNIWGGDYWVCISKYNGVV